MKIIAKTLLASSLCVLMAVPAHAGRYHDDGPLVKRVERQHTRIVSGVKSGALTHKETRKLKKQTHKTRSMARKFREDDVLSLKERRILNNRLDKASHRIWKFKHNDRERHTGWSAFQDTYRDAKRHHGHSGHNERNERNEHNRNSGRDGHHPHRKHHDNDDGIVNWIGKSEAWPRYSFLYW